MPRATNQLRDLARLGAEVRLRELKQEVAALLEHFPDLRQLRGRAAAHDAAAATPRAARTGRGRRRRISAEGRERIRQAQLKRWAAVRAGKKR